MTNTLNKIAKQTNEAIKNGFTPQQIVNSLTNELMRTSGKDKETCEQVALTTLYGLMK